MSVYVDALCDHDWRLHGRRTKSCHLIADSLDELHAMATAIGMKRAWYQPLSAPHYDLTAPRRAHAVALGAIELDRVAFVGVIRRLRAERKAAA